MKSFTHFIQSENNGSEYAKDQAKKWRNMGYSVKSIIHENGTELLITRNLKK